MKVLHHYVKRNIEGRPVQWIIVSNDAKTESIVSVAVFPEEKVIQISHLPDYRVNVVKINKER